MSDNPLAPGNQAPSSYSALRGERPAWITSPQATVPPNVMAFRLHFDMEHEALIRVHVSADERYQLYIDGQRVGIGPERGSDRIWFYETYELNLSAGSHTFVALVWHLGAIGPDAQVGLQAGFLLEAEEPYAALLSTKWADWETKPVEGIRFSLPGGAKDAAYFVQPIQMTEGADYPWGIECGQGEGWMPTRKRHEDFLFGYGLYPTHNLQPAVLPSQVSRVRSLGCVRYVGGASWNDPQIVKVRPDANLPAEANAYQALLDESAALVVPPHTKRQFIMDLEQYVCAYPQITVSGGKGSHLTIGWAEALHLDASGTQKGQRDEVMGRTFIALCRDVIRPDGGAKRQFEALWWRSGRYVQLLIETADEPLTVESLSLLETRYPLEMESQFSSSDARLEAVMPIMLRALQMCTHETYMDCPYYEQLMYIGDTRLEAVATYTISVDDRLPRKAIKLFGLSQLPDGMIRARYPSREIQVIPPFSLWWIGMVYDYAMWRNDRAFIVEMLPKVRAVLDGFLAHVNSDNLLQASSGWNFADWTLDWPLGVPPDAFTGISGVLNWHLIYTLGLAAKLEAWAGEQLLARRWETWQKDIASAARVTFWDEQRGLFADDQTRNHFSEHVQ
ncbi:MAG: alpha-L-rhamnosidase, partial [Anaerolineae bacterium]|nr:alpha-L-rhamnosidase [Anaerolineae bacterium]